MAQQAEAAKFRSWWSSQVFLAPAPLRPVQGLEQSVGVHIRTGAYESSKFSWYNTLRHASGLTTPATYRALFNVIRQRRYSARSSHSSVCSGTSL